MLLPAHSLAWHGTWDWLALISVINLPSPAVPVNHTYKFSYNYHFTHTWQYGQMTYSYTHIQITVSLLVLPHSRQAGQLALTPYVGNSTVQYILYSSFENGSVTSIYPIQYSTSGECFVFLFKRRIFFLLCLESCNYPLLTKCTIIYSS
jgi:hypothetical protein